MIQTRNNNVLISTLKGAGLKSPQSNKLSSDGIDILATEVATDLLLEVVVVEVVEVVVVVVVEGCLLEERLWSSLPFVAGLLLASLSCS